MSATERFADTNVLLYLLSSDGNKADRAEEVVSTRPALSVQVLNEFAAVASRKLRMAIPEIREILATLRAVCPVVAVTEETHDSGMDLAERFGFSIFDAMIVAAAIESGCRELLSEDMQDGLHVDGRLVIRDPFR